MLWASGSVMLGGDDAAGSSPTRACRSRPSMPPWAGSRVRPMSAAEIDGLIALADQLGRASSTPLAPKVDLTAAAGLRPIAARAEAAGRCSVRVPAVDGHPDLAVANQLCEDAGPAAGILLDPWHWVAARRPRPRLCAHFHPPDHSVQRRRRRQHRTPAGTEAMTARLLPGDGVVNYAEQASTTSRHAGRRRR